MFSKLIYLILKTELAKFWVVMQGRLGIRHNKNAVLLKSRQVGLAKKKKKSSCLRQKLELHKLPTIWQSLTIVKVPHKVRGSFSDILDFVLSLYMAIYWYPMMWPEHCPIFYQCMGFELKFKQRKNAFGAHLMFLVTLDEMFQLVVSS